MRQYLLKHKWIVIGIIIFTIVSSVITILTPLFVGRIVNNFSFFNLKIFIYILLFLVNVIQNMLLSYLSVLISNNIRNNLFAKINKIKLKEIDKIQYGDIINKFSVDVENVTNGFILAISKIINGIIIVILVGIYYSTTYVYIIKNYY